MITQVMDFCNNHFLRTSESPDITFKDTTDVYTIEADFADTYIVGQYIYICGSLVNDGAYLVSAFEAGKITTLDTVIDELPTDKDNTVFIFGLAVPRGFLSIITDIETWVTNNGGNEGIASEKIDDYSISFGNGGNDNTWQGAFSNRLSTYKAIYNDLDRYYRHGY